MPSQLYRSQTNRMLLGVCGGLADYLQVDPVLIRLAFIILALASGTGVLVYLALAIIMPSQVSLDRAPSEVMRENAQEIAATARQFAEDVRSGFSGRPQTRLAEAEGEPVPVETLSERDRAQERRNLAGVIIVVLGVLALLSNLGLLWWLNWSLLWPLALIVIGVIILLARRG